VGRAVRGGDGRADTDAEAIYEIHGQVTLDKASPRFMGANEHTNNTGELTGTGENIKWAIDHDTRPDDPIMIRPDSLYTMSMIIGDSKPTANVALVHTIRKWYKQLLKQRKGRVRWAHVKGHSDHKWNDVVDELATRGTNAGEHGGCGPGERWKQTRIDGNLIPHTPRYACDANITTTTTHHQRHTTITTEIRPTSKTWPVPIGTAPTREKCTMAIECDQITRVLRADTDLGCLSLLPQQGISDTQTKNAYSTIHTSILATQHNHTQANTTRALEKLYLAKTRTDTINKRNTLAAHDDDPQNLPTIITSDCPIDVATLRAYINSPIADKLYVDSEGIQTRITNGAKTQDFLDALEEHIERTIRPDEDTIWIRVEYRYARMGQHLKNAGYITKSRLYAKSFNPFKKWNRTIRFLALGRFGYELDDAGAYPTAGAHMIDLGRNMVSRFLTHRKQILEAIGSYYFPEVTDIIKYERAKQLNNALDNDGTLQAWANIWRVDLRQKPINRLNVRLPDGRFDVGDYITLQKERADEIKKLMPDLLAYITQTGKDFPERTMRSYLLQEYESRSCDIKTCVAESDGHFWFSLQYDGVVMGLLPGTDKDILQTRLTDLVSHGLDYRQEVAI
jgi:ribonuclease HI